MSRRSESSDDHVDGTVIIQKSNGPEKGHALQKHNGRWYLASGWESAVELPTSYRVI